MVLIGAAILHDGPAAADPNQDDRFLALLEKKEIPAVANVPRVIDAAHKVCRKLDGGMPVNDIVDGLRNDAYNIDPVMRLYPVRLTTTMTRFISAAVEIYCPNHHSKMAFAMANFEPGSNEPTHRVAASTRSAVNSGSDLRASVSDMTIMSPGWREPTGAMLASVLGAVRAGDPLIPNPPPIPVPPPAAQTLIPPRRSWHRRHRDQRRRNSRRPRRQRLSRLLVFRSPGALPAVAAPAAVVAAVVTDR